VKYQNLNVVCGGVITPLALKCVWMDLDSQKPQVRQEFWEYMFEMGSAFGDIQSFVIQDRQQELV
jgi:hypothetical protein